ncbi:hypothetical protein [Mesorhizobium sp. B4-1-3]|uniref:hypothetical protein n=1 Tax=Mesorhizobium sp. B4-1-3 TaxID=2589889 RepID=UPI0015E2A6FE|nr:hypothetical protein [Mesorhizobium sp. B4-1-3]
MDVGPVSAVADQLSDIGGSIRRRGAVDRIPDRHARYVPVIQAGFEPRREPNPKAG